MLYSDERYRFLFESSPAAVYSIDASGVIQDFKCPMAQVAAGVLSEVSNGEVIIQRPDGSRITVIVNIRALTGPDGEIVGAINCFYDITERFRMEQLLQHQANMLSDENRRKDEFLAMLSHELRNPLAPIVTSMQVLEKLAGEAPEQKKVLSIVERQLAQLIRLVDDLTDASRIGRGIVKLRLEDVAIGDVVERAVESARHLVDERSHELAVVLPPEPIRLRADATRLEQIIVNLLANAAKYTDRGGRIWLSIEQERDECTLRVRDTGIGISPELLPHVFELFAQAAPTSDRSQGGLGIGLGSCNVSSSCITGEWKRIACWDRAASSL